MSLPSFKLSEGEGGRLWATTEIEGKKWRFATKVSDQAAAEKIAEKKIARRLAAQKASRERWRKFHADRAAAGGAPPRALAPIPPAPSSPAPSSPALTTNSSSSSPPASGSSGSGLVDRAVRAAEINERMRRRAGIAHEDDQPGAGPPERPPDDGDDDAGDAGDAGDELDDDDDDDQADGIKPDKVIPPDPDDDDDDDEPGEDDVEAQEFIADALVEGTLTGTTKLGAYIAKSDRVPILGFKKKPRVPNEPSEKAVDLARKGLQIRARKLLGPTSKLGTDAKIMVGLFGIVLSMSWGAEELEDDNTRTAAAGTGPRPRPPAGDDQAEDEDDEPPPQAKPPPRPPAPAPGRLALVPRSSAPATPEESANGKFRG
jgi:hypothetical protein